MDGRWFILLIAALVVIFIIMIFVRRQRREGYNIIFGQAGATKGLRNHYYNCLSECQREDPNKYFTSDAFMRCDYKCSNDITELSEEQKCAESKLDVEDPKRRCAPHVYAMEPKTLIDSPNPRIGSGQRCLLGTVWSRKRGGRMSGMVCDNVGDQGEM